MLNMINVVCAPHDAKFLEELQKTWRNIRNEAIPEFKIKGVSWDGNTPTLPWAQASMLMVQQMSTMRKVNHV